MHRAEAYVVRLLSIALLMVTAACTETRGEPSEVTPAAIAAAAESIDDAWGAPVGFALTVATLDAGYGPTQIIDGGVTADAEVPDSAPAGDSTGFIEPPSDAVGAALAAADLVLLADREPGERWLNASYQMWALGTIYETAVEQAMRPDTAAEREAEQAEAREAELTAVVLGLASRGYGLDQILDALVDVGRVQAQGALSANCLFIAAPGTRVAAQPTGPDLMASECNDVGSATASGEPAGEPQSAVDPLTLEGPLTIDEVGLPGATDSHVAIDRAADGTYSLNAFVEYSTTVYDCSWEGFQTWEGTGALNDAGTEIEFSGTFTEEQTASGSDCAETNTSEQTTTVVSVDGDRLTGSPFPYTEFSLVAGGSSG